MGAVTFQPGAAAGGLSRAAGELRPSKLRGQKSGFRNEYFNRQDLQFVTSDWSLELSDLFRDDS